MSSAFDSGGVEFILEGGIALMLARAATVAALLSLFGALVFQAYIMPRALGCAPSRWKRLRNREAAQRDGPDSQRRPKDSPIPGTDPAGPMVSNLIVASIIAAALAMPTWLLLQTGEMAGASSLAGAATDVPEIVLHTAYGHLIALQAAGLLAIGLAYRRNRVRRWVALGLAGLDVALQAGHGHAASMADGPSLLLAAGVIHLLGAGAWLGGLMPLGLFVAAMPARAGASAARWFSPLGKICVVAVAGSAAIQGWVLVGGIPGLVGTAYGWMAMTKIGLFGVLFVFAMVNRYWFAPALRDGDAAKPVLVRSIAVQTGFGLAVIVAAAVLSSVEPAMHVQPIWPFPDLFTPETVQEDPDALQEVAFAGIALAGGMLLLVFAWFMRHPARWLAAAAGLVVAGLAAPHLDLMFVPAYPTSFYRSPTGFAATSIMSGAALFPQHCAACHGVNGRGDGPMAASLSVPPADLTTPHLWGHRDGEMFWWLSHGIEGADGSLVMPGFAAELSDDERWALIDFIRALNAGAVYGSAGAWTPAVAAPELQAVCEAGRVISLSDLHGGYVRLVTGRNAGAALPGVTIILVTADPAARAAPGVCVAADLAVPRAYAILVGLTGYPPPGTQFLIDSDGVLRAVQNAGSVGGWNDPSVLAAELRRLKAHPVEAVGAGHMSMPMH